ncbi:MAG: hypothetical protein KDD69_09260, partial [Bdellovibrionales bacterium]|nr:hypothetical protein [Bdellovibrionales bacterium]
MELSEEDRRRLDQLMEQHLNGELSDDEYRRRSWEILKQNDTTDPILSGEIRASSLGAASALSQEVNQRDIEHLEVRLRPRRRPVGQRLKPLIVVFAFGILVPVAIGVIKA